METGLELNLNYNSFQENSSNTHYTLLHKD